MKVSPEQLIMPWKVEYQYTDETMVAAWRLRNLENLHGSTTVAVVSMAHAMSHAHPLLVMADCLMKVAEKRSSEGSLVARDYVLGPEWKSAWEGVHGMLGAVDMEPIDNATVSGILYKALEISGYEESDV